MNLYEKRLLFVFLFSFFIAGIIVLFLRDPFGLEIRAGVFVRDILEQASYICPTTFGEPYFDYPPLFFVLESFFCRFCKEISALCLALPSLLSATIIIYLVYIVGKNFYNENTAIIASLILFATPEFWLKAEKATLDMSLSLSCFASIMAFYNYFFLKRNLLIFLLAFLFLAASYFLKGLIGIVLIISPFIIFFILLKEYRLLCNFLFMSFLYTACLLIIHFFLLRNHFGDEIVLNILNSQVLSRVGHQSNKPFYYYFVYLFLVFSPWFLWIFYLILKRYLTVLDVKIFKNRFTLFLICVFLGEFAPFVVASSKHSRYLLPLFPFISLFLASYLSRFFTLKDLTHKKSRLFLLSSIFLFFATVLTTFAIEPFISKKESGRLFVYNTEATLSDDYIIYLYKMKKDGDGLKYALFSKFYPANIKFLHSIDDIKHISTSGVIVTFEKDLKHLIDKITFKKLITTGFIHNKKVVALDVSKK